MDPVTKNEPSSLDQTMVTTSLRWHVHADPHNGNLTGSCSQKELFLKMHLARMCAAADSLGFVQVSQLLASSHMQDRLEKGINETLGVSASNDHKLSVSQNAITLPDTKVYKVRVVVDRNCVISIQNSVIQTVPPTDPVPYGQWDFAAPQDARPSCVVYMDTAATVPSLLTKHKTTQRSMYDNARLRTGVTNKPLTEAEALMWNMDSHIMETSFCTVYFNRSGWVTPSTDSGGNLGVSRRFALNHGLCREEVIHKSDVVDGEIVWLSNAVRGFFQGKICLTSKSAVAV